MKGKLTVLNAFACVYFACLGCLFLIVHLTTQRHMPTFAIFFAGGIETEPLRALSRQDSIHQLRAEGSS